MIDALDAGYLVDTNVLLRLFRKDDLQYPMVKAALGALNSRGIGLYFSLQNIAEFWNVCTRPSARNGYGLTIAETNLCVEQIERTMTFVPDSEQAYSGWRKLLVEHSVRGVQVHDARLVATMQAYGLTSILTFNGSDFGRYVGIEAVNPADVRLPNESQ